MPSWAARESAFGCLERALFLVGLMSHQDFQTPNLSWVFCLAREAMYSSWSLQADEVKQEEKEQQSHERTVGFRVRIPLK
jgi:hypothetical protein